jgi:hypothetical protein
MTGKSTPAWQKEKRLAAALRENLKRRRAQAKARAGAEDKAGGHVDTGLPPQSDGDLNR